MTDKNYAPYGQRNWWRRSIGGAPHWLLIGLGGLLLLCVVVIVVGIHSRS